MKATVDKDIDNRLSKASSSFGHLSKRVWQNHALHIPTKIQVYRAVVLTSLLYGSETWVLHRRQIRLLERFQQHCLRSIMNIKWQDYITNNAVFDRAGIPSVENTLLQ